MRGGQDIWSFYSACKHLLNSLTSTVALGGSVPLAVSWARCWHDSTSSGFGGDGCSQTPTRKPRSVSYTSLFLELSLQWLLAHFKKQTSPK